MFGLYVDIAQCLLMILYSYPCKIQSVTIRHFFTKLVSTVTGGYSKVEFFSKFREILAYAKKIGM
jgi:hypothetical protein